MKLIPLISRAVFLLAALALGPPASAAQPLKTRNVILITADGLRWQEVFRGAEEALLNKEAGGVRETDALRRDFWRTTPEERRRALLPFFWGQIASRGQI